MQVKKVHKFITKLQEQIPLTVEDTKFFNALNLHFSKRNAEEQLTDVDKNLISNCYKERWKIDSLSDYTLNPEGVNAVWIDFAKKFASEINSNYVRLLLNGVNNTRDLNDLSPIAETRHMEHFYLGTDVNDQIHLFRKRSLCEFLLNNNYKLATYRDIHTRKLSAMTLIELWRLNTCNQSNGEFSIDDEKFKSFWDFLRKKVFVHLQKQGTLPEDITKSVQDLTNKYVELKDLSADFNEFKQFFNSFLSTLYKHKLEDINFFYGCKLFSGDKDRYLLDLLIDIQSAKTYALDSQMTDLRHWVSSHTATVNPIKSIGEVNNEQKCMHFILSLFTMQFSDMSLRRKHIYLWDKENTVFGEAEELFKQFFPLLLDGNKQAVLERFGKVMDEKIKHETSRSDFLHRLRSNSIRSSWYTHVQNGTLPSCGVHWFEPELLFHVLSKYLNKTTHLLSFKIRNVLDEIIHTYYLNKNELMKAIRVNILFSELLKSTIPSDHDFLLHELTLCDSRVDQSTFLQDVYLYLTEHSGCHESELTFFKKSNSSYVDKLEDGVKGIVNSFRNKIHARNHQKGMHPDDNVTRYFVKLTEAILTVEEKKDAERSVGVLDYCGAPT